MLAAVQRVLRHLRRGQGGGARPGAAAQAEAQPPVAHELAELVPGRSLRYRDEELVVERSMTFECDTESWTEHRLSSDRAGHTRWLEVQHMRGLVVTMYERLPVGGPPPEEPTFDRDGITYELSERGAARYRTRERAGAGKVGRVDYVEYVAGRVRLAYERFDEGRWEVSLGHLIEPRDLHLYGS